MTSREIAPLDKGQEKLTEMQKLFCREYLVDLEQTAAALRAGYSKHTACVQASQLMARPKIQKCIQAMMEQRARRLSITADYVLGTIQETIQRCRKAGDAKGVLKGTELLGKHLKLFTDVTETKHTFNQMPTVEISDPNNPQAGKLKLQFDIGSEPDKLPNDTQNDL